MADLNELKERTKFIWAQGDYPEVATYLTSAAEALVEACGVGAGTKMLDVGAGNGNVAIAAAKRGADVIASDITPELIEAGRERAAQEGLDIQWREADAEELPFEDDVFDVVTSCFGAMFAPRAEHTAEEMLRVTKPGGKVGFTSWANDGFQGEVFSAAYKYAPPPPEGVDSPVSWGDENLARQRFGKFASNVEITRGTVPWHFESAEAWAKWGSENVPPIVVARKMLPPETFGKLEKESIEVAERFNQSSDAFMVDSEYLLLVATK